MTIARQCLGARLGARIGILVGCTSWIVVLGILALCQGRAAMLVEVIAPLLFASLGLALLVLLASEPLLAGKNEPLLAGQGERAGDATPARPGHLMVVLGSVAFATGMLLLLADGFVAPALAADPELARGVLRSGGVLALPRWLATALLAAGATTLAAALRRTSATADREDAPAPGR